MWKRGGGERLVLCVVVRWNHVVVGGTPAAWTQWNPELGLVVALSLRANVHTLDFSLKLFKC